MFKLIIAVLLVVILFFPFFSITIVPEWELQLFNKDGSVASEVKIDQVWKDYSLEWTSGEERESGLKTDSNGYLRLPKREIRISIFGVIVSHIRDAVMGINPHASFGSSSYIICRGTQNCVVSYTEGSEKPQKAVLW